MSRSARGAAALVAALLVVTAGGCTSDDTAEHDEVSTPSGEQVDRVPPVSAPVTHVAGRLSDAERLALRREVETWLRRYVEKGFVDPEATPRTAFPGFTEGAARLARAEGAILWRADLRAAEVEARRVEGTVHAFAPGGQLEGATLRLDLALDANRGNRTQRVRLTGRVLLTPVGGGLKVFGFDVRRSDR